jgi:PPK2 family polyphosphate:nucleotide phosphotransferase
MTLLSALLVLAWPSLGAQKTLRPPALPAAAVKAAAAPAGVSAASPLAAKSAAAPTSSAVETVNAVYAELGKGAWTPAATFTAAFDGTFKKGSIEERFVAPDPANGRVDLSRLDPSDTMGLRKKEIKALRKAEKEKLEPQQKVLYGAKQRAAVALFNGIDTGGKDGRIKALFKGLDPHSAGVVSNKQPSAEDAKHHYLWRHVKTLPGPGKIVLFNRSYYEDVVVPLILPAMYKKAWGTLPDKQEILRRLDEMNAFEKRLVDEGYVVLKFFLHISRDEQKKRLEARRDDFRKNYKFSEDDLLTRKRWNAFHRAWGEILAHNNTSYAPFFVVPANDKKFADYVVRAITRRAFKRARMTYPKAKPGTDKIVIPD